MTEQVVVMGDRNVDGALGAPGRQLPFADVYPKAGHVRMTWQHDLRDFAPRLFR